MTNEDPPDYYEWDRIDSFTRCLWGVIIIVVLLVILVIVIRNTKQYEPKYKNSLENYLTQPNIHHYPEFRYSVLASISGYNATVEQCDSTPFIMASGKRVYDGAIANNCQPFGTRVEIDGKMYRVEDRMNEKYGCEYYDIFFWDYDDARNWGVRHKIVKIYR